MNYDSLKSKNFRYAIKLLTFIVTMVIVSQGYGQAQPQVFFNKLTIADGLSNNKVKSIAKGPKGFMWFGTNNGLNRYDGKDVKIYNQQNSNLVSNDIQDILIDSKNNIWIATLGGGLALYDPLNDDFKIFEHIPGDDRSIPSNQVIKLYEDSSGRFWIGMETGLCLFDSQSGGFSSLEEFLTEPVRIASSVTSFFEDSRKNLWVGTFGGGLITIDLKEKSVKEIQWNEYDNSTDFVHSILSLNQEQLLIGTVGRGLVTLDVPSGKTSDFFKDKFKKSVGVPIVRALIMDSLGNLWIGTDGLGVFKVEKPNSANPVYHNYRHSAKNASSLSGNGIYEIIEDDDSNIWIGTAWNGANILDEKINFEIIYSDIIGNNPYPVLSIFKDNNQIFIGSDGMGLTVNDVKTDQTTYYNKEGKNALNANYIQYITKSKNGTYWLGAFANGLINFSVEKGIIKHYKHKSSDKNSLSYNDVRYIIEDGDENLWIATWEGGLNYLNTKNGRFEQYRQAHDGQNSISSDNIVSLLRDKNRIWIATFGGGVNCFDTETKKFSSYRHDKENPNSISTDNTVSILKDTRGYLWIGTSGSGVDRYDPHTGTFEHFKDKELLRYATINSIIEDNEGKIWFGTTDGIYKYDHTTEDFSKFPYYSDEFHINSAFKDELGLLYFGGINGVFHFDPKEIAKDVKQPEIVFTNFKLFNKELQIGADEILTQNITYKNKVSLEHDQNIITLGFAALKFPFADNREYSVKMQGLGEDWRNIGKERSVTYTNLSHGDYTFKVRSREKSMDWGQQQASMEIEILRPFWLRWWAYLIYILIAATLLYLFRKYSIAWERLKSNLRIEQLTREKDKELYNFKQRFFTNISHEIRTPVTLILGSIERLANTYGFFENKQAKTFDIIKRNSTHLLGLVNELLDIRSLEYNELKLKVTNNDIITFSNEIYLSFTELAFDKKIDYTFDCPSNPLFLWFDKTQMEKVLYNLLSNAFKYTSDGATIDFKIEETDGHVLLTLTDTGKGISKKQRSKIFHRFYRTGYSDTVKKSGFGLGLSIAKEIVSLHRGEITVQSEKGQGSTFGVKLTKGNKHFSSEFLIRNDGENEESIENYLIHKNSDDTLKKDLDLTDLSAIEGQTVLIVEDNDDIRDYLVELLARHCTVEETANGKEGLKSVEDNMPDLIISDIMMPVMDGIKLAREIKLDVRTSHIPIILLTARASFAHKMEGYDTGADAYITKPFNEEILLTRIKNLILNRNLLRRKFSSDGLFLPNELAINKRDIKFLETLVSLIHDNLDSKNLNSDFICKNIGMSHSVVYKKTKALTGLSLVEFVRDYKLKVAKKMLIEQRLPVIEVCTKVGYSDRKYFSKMFKQRFGKNPSEFLQKNN